MRTSLCLLALAVAGCADPAQPAVQPTEPLATDSVAAPADSVPDPNAALRDTLLSLYSPDAGEVRVFSGEADLDGDGAPEIVVHVAGPLVCGSGGCTTLVFTSGPDGLRRVGDISVSRPPIVAGETQTNGWRDLLVGVSGGGAQGGQARLRFDGTAYPGNPTVAPAEPVTGDAEGEVIIDAFDSFADGELLREPG